MSDKPAKGKKTTVKVVKARDAYYSQPEDNDLVLGFVKVDRLGRVDDGHLLSPGKPVPNSGFKCFGFSKQSRKKVEFCEKVIYETARLVVKPYYLVTLTFADDYDSILACRNFIIRSLKNVAPLGVWVEELHESGKPHFHFLVLPSRKWRYTAWISRILRNKKYKLFSPGIQVDEYTTNDNRKPSYLSDVFYLSGARKQHRQGKGGRVWASWGIPAKPVLIEYLQLSHFSLASSVKTAKERVFLSAKLYAVALLTSKNQSIL